MLLQPAVVAIVADDNATAAETKSAMLPVYLAGGEVNLPFFKKMNLKLPLFVLSPLCNLQKSKIPDVNPTLTVFIGYYLLLPAHSDAAKAR